MTISNPSFASDGYFAAADADGSGFVVDDAELSGGYALYVALAGDVVGTVGLSGDFSVGEGVGMADFEGYVYAFCG